MVRGHADERSRVRTVYFTAVVHSGAADQDYNRQSPERFMSQEIKRLCCVDLAYFLMEEHSQHTAG